MPAAKPAAEKAVRAIYRSLSSRLGLTGKILLHVAWILAVSLALLVTLAHARARAGIRDQLRATEAARIQQWSARHDAAIRGRDAWKMAEALSELQRDPYVVFAGLYDASGKPVARVGDEAAYERAHALNLVVGVRSGAGESSGAAQPAEPPLPGLTPEPRRAERPVPFKEGFREVVEASGGGEKDLLGWVEVTLTTAPLDALASRTLRPLVVLGLLIFSAGLILTWLLARSITVPLRLLGQNADRMAEGGLDVPFDEVPRPPDEVGDLATRLSIMAGRIRKDHEEMRDRIRRLEEERLSR